MLELAPDRQIIIGDKKKWLNFFDQYFFGQILSGKSSYISSTAE